MDPNNNQQQGISSQQAAPQPQNPVQSPIPPAPQVVDQQTTQFQNPNVNKSSKTTLLLIVLLILVVAMSAYLFFLSTNSNNSENLPVTTRNVPSPAISTPTPTPQLEADGLDVEDPEIDLKDLENSALEL